MGRLDGRRRRRPASKICQRFDPRDVGNGFIGADRGYSYAFAEERDDLHEFHAGWNAANRPTPSCGEGGGAPWLRYNIMRHPLTFTFRRRDDAAFPNNTLPSGQATFAFWTGTQDVYFPTHTGAMTPGQSIISSPVSTGHRLQLTYIGGAGLRRENLTPNACALAWAGPNGQFVLDSIEAPLTETTFRVEWI